MTPEHKSPSGTTGILEVAPEEQVQNAVQNPSTAQPAGTEIDLTEVIDAFRESNVAVCDEKGFDRDVCWVQGDDAALVEMEPCPTCGHDQGQPVFSIDKLEFRVVLCTECETGQLHPQPTPEQIQTFYPPEYYGTTGAKFEPLVESVVRLVGARQARSLTRGVPDGGRILDIGCGRGVVLSALADRGYEVHGFEISPTAAEGADPRAQIRIADDLKEARYLDDCFDQVILWHVLEHLPNPRETLAEIHRILKPGGRLAVAVPNFSSTQARWTGPNWFHLDLPRHLYHFPLRGLRQLLTSSGFQCREEHHFSLRQNPFGWIQSLLNRDPGLPRNGLYTLLKRHQNSKNGLFDTPTLWKLRIAYWLGMPLAAIASFLTTLTRSGASVSIIAEADKSEPQP